MSFRKRKHGYEDDDHVVKRQMVAEEVSLFGNYTLLRCTSSGYRLKLMGFLFCRSGPMRIWMHCDNEIVFKLATSSAERVERFCLTLAITDRGCTSQTRL